MGKREFDEYLKKQRADAEGATQIDWGKKKDEWLGYLGGFYKQVEGFLSEYTKSGAVVFEYGDQDMDEEYIGKYCAKWLRIRIKDQNVLLSPVGTNVIGAKGRIDMVGLGGTVRFVLVDKKMAEPWVSVTIRTEDEHAKDNAIEKEERIEWTWKIATPPPRVKYIQMNAESFLDALMEVINA